MNDLLAALKAHVNPDKAAGQAAYHKVSRGYLGVPNPVINDLTKSWRRELSLDQRIDGARALWASDIHEARIAAAKLLTQARIRPDDCAVWALIKSWVPEFDAWAIADHVSSAGERRLRADPTRLDEIEAWTRSDHLWTKRAALVMTLPWTKSNHPDAREQAERERILGWAASYVDDRDWFIQKAIAWWIRSLSRHDPARARDFLAAHGPAMKAFARKDAGRLLSG